MIFAHGMYNVLYKYRSHDKVNICLLTYKSKENYNSVQLEASRSNRPCPNPIAVTPIWKWELANGLHSIEGLHRIFFEKFVFKFPFSHRRFQMGQKMYLYLLYKV